MASIKLIHLNIIMAGCLILKVRGQIVDLLVGLRWANDTLTPVVEVECIKNVSKISLYSSLPFHREREEEEESLERKTWFVRVTKVPVNEPEFLTSVLSLRLILSFKLKF